MKKVPTIASVTDHETQGKRIYTDIFLIPEDSVDLSTEPEIDDFIENQHGRGFFIGTIDRVSGKKKIYGRPRCPYYFQNHSRRKNGENTSCDITFTSPFIFQPLEYLGEFTTTVKPGT